MGLWPALFMWLSALSVHFIIIACIIRIVRKKRQENKCQLPEELSKIRYIRFDYLNRPGTDEWCTTEYEVSVRWDNYEKCGVLFVDSYVFADKSVEKHNFVFMDAEKNIIPMEGYSYSIEIAQENDCGFLLIKPV